MRRRVRTNARRKRGGVVEHRDRTRLTGERVLYRKLRDLNGGRRFACDKGLLGITRDRIARVPRTVVPGASLVRRILLKMRATA